MATLNTAIARYKANEAARLLLHLSCSAGMQKVFSELLPPRIFQCFQEVQEEWEQQHRYFYSQRDREAAESIVRAPLATELELWDRTADVLLPLLRTYNELTEIVNGMETTYQAKHEDCRVLVEAIGLMKDNAPSDRIREFVDGHFGNETWWFLLEYEEMKQEMPPDDRKKLFEACLIIDIEFAIRRKHGDIAKSRLAALSKD